MDNKGKYSFFIDIDGTLITHQRLALSDRLRRAILLARAEGAMFFINTARSRSYIPDTLTDGNVFDGICCGGGTYIELGGKCIYSRYISEEILCSMATSMIKNKEETVLCFEGSEHMYYMGKKQDWFTENFLPVSSPDDFRTIYKDAKIQKFATTGSSLPSEQLIKDFSQWFDVLVYPRYIEGMSFGYDKGEAIKIAEKVLDLDHAYTVAVGDSKNDLPMFRYAAISVAMGNAPDEIKKTCTYVTESADNDGVAAIIERLTGVTETS